MVDLNKLKQNIGTLGKKASESTVIGIANGAYRLGERAFVVGKETVKLAKAVHQKDTAKQKEAAEKIVDEVVVKTAKGVVSIGKQVGKTAVSAVDCALEKNPILKDKKLHSTIVGGAAIVGTIAAGAVIGDMVEASIAEASPDLDASALGAPDLAPASVFLPDIDINQIDGITNSTVFPNADINALAEAGMKPELIDNHIDSSLIDRSETAKTDFLHSIGRSALPNGFEIHHVVPLSQGGLDIPANMVLIPEDAHDIITEQHRTYYNW